MWVIFINTILEIKIKKFKKYVFKNDYKSIYVNIEF